MVHNHKNECMSFNKKNRQDLQMIDQSIFPFIGAFEELMFGIECDYRGFLQGIVFDFAH